MKPKDIFDIELKNLSRKDFLKYTSTAALLSTIPLNTGCSSLKLANVPEDINYKSDIILSNGNIIDVKTGKISRNSSILIRKGKIHSVIKKGIDFKGAVKLDLKGKYVIPGLIDAHCHPTVSPVFSMSAFDVFKHVEQQKRHLSISIENGVTTLRDVGSFPPTLHGFIKDIKNETLLGPRITYANSMLNIKGGHPDMNPSDVNIFAKPASLFIGMVMINFQDNDELQEALRDNTKGASLIKITMDNKSVFCRKDNITVYSDEHLKMIFKAAEKKNLPVAAHCHRKWGFQRSMKYPVNSMEHIVSDEYLSDKDIETMAKKKVSIVPTMTVGQSYMIEEAYTALPKEYRNDFILNEIKIKNNYLKNEADKHCNPYLHKTNMAMTKYYKSLGWDKLWENNKFLVNPDLYFGMMKYGSKNLRKMKDAGILIGCAIDAGMPFSYFGGMYRELELYSRIGFNNLEILQSATINNAKIINMVQQIGSIEEGKFADLVILNKNPLKDVKAYRDVEIVLKGGKFLHSKGSLSLSL